jgi:hypothetical protein
MDAPLPHSIELHDSCLGSVEQRSGGDLVVGLEPAYVHKDGKGWIQKARLVFRAGELETSREGIPGMIADGWFTMNGGQVENLVPVELRLQEPVSFTALLRTRQQVVISGTAFHCELVGEPKYVEDVA